MISTIRDYDLTNKRVIIRVDFNVPMDGNTIVDDNRIKASLETINYAINKGAKVILLSHMGRIKCEDDKIKNTLKPVSIRLSELLNKDVLFIDETRGSKLEEAVNNLKTGDVLLIENTRFEDLNGKLESSNDKELAAYWASLGDIFINDAFATSHRSHASNVGIASILPSGIGFLVEKEINNISKVINNPTRPFTVILGGAKVSDKIKVIENLVNIADHILIGGAMAYTFLKSSDLEVGRSLVDLESIDFCKEMLKNHRDKIILPIDSVNSSSLNGDIVLSDIDKIDKDLMGLDIGPKTVNLFKTYLDSSKTVVWNGSLGYCENLKFAHGTEEVCKILKDVDAIKVVGGGDTVAIVNKLNYDNVFTHVSTGGGASLEMLEGKVLPGIGIISDKNEKES